MVYSREEFRPSQKHAYMAVGTLCSYHIITVKGRVKRYFFDCAAGIYMLDWKAGGELFLREAENGGHIK